MTFDEHVSSMKMPRNLGFLLAPTNCFSLCQIYVSDVVYCEPTLILSQAAKSMYFK